MPLSLSIAPLFASLQMVESTGRGGRSYQRVYGGNRAGGSGRTFVQAGIGSGGTESDVPRRY